MNEQRLKKQIQRLLACAAALLLLPSLALAVPTQVSQQGRLLDDSGAGLTGSHSLEFTLFSDANGSASVWSESHTLELDNGYYSVVLGADSSNPLDDSVLSLDELYLGMTVDDGSLMQPLLQVTSAPYAIHSRNLAGGYADASEIYIDGTLVVDAAGDWVGNVLPGTLASLGCADGEQARYTTASGWACVSPGEHFTAADAVTAMGAEDPSNPLNHIRYNDSDAIAAMGALGSGNPLNHDRYSNSDAIAAMGSQSNSNSYNHARYTDTEAAAALNTADSYVRNTGDTMTGTLRMQANSPSILFDDTSVTGSLGAEWELSAGSSNFEINRPSLGSTSTNNLRIVPGSSGSIQLRPNNHTTLTAQANGNVVVDEHVFSERYAFSARTGSSPLYPSTTPTVDGWRVPFNELQDNGSVFSGSSFTVPRTGYYSLSMSFAFEGGDGIDDEWRVAFTQRSPGDISSSVIQSLYCNPRYQSRNSRRVSNASLTTVARLTQGDTISIRISGIASSSTDVSIRRGYFSGFYLGE